MYSYGRFKSLLMGPNRPLIIGVKVPAADAGERRQPGRPSIVPDMHHPNWCRAGWSFPNAAVGVGLARCVRTHLIDCSFN
ncbi:hypothetical protein ARTHRO8AJ_370183 [Arthrobacter sp. 8AJ]|nr:hypothetical protein ARTHRO8AJ_370183 [Arthrobacter sp. 8AJ]